MRGPIDFLEDLFHALWGGFEGEREAYRITMDSLVEDCNMLTEEVASLQERLHSQISHILPALQAILDLADECGAQDPKFHLFGSTIAGFQDWITHQIGTTAPGPEDIAVPVWNMEIFGVPVTSADFVMFQVRLRDGSELTITVDRP